MQNLRKLAEHIEAAGKITVFTGAGISTSCGIPDFRSPGGIYSIVGREMNLPSPEAVFDLNYFRRDPGPFFALSCNLLFKRAEPSLCHKFIAWLEERKEVQVITQNIDGLHLAAGSTRVMECHGSYTTAHCMGCSREYTFEQIKESLKEGSVPFCGCGGVIKPDIVFFGENLPEEFYSYYMHPPESDLLIVLGTSLTVHPAADLVLKIAESCPSFILNKDTTPYDHFFLQRIPGDLDTAANKLWSLLKSSRKQMI